MASHAGGLRDGAPIGLPDLGLAAPALIGGLEGPVAGSPWRAELSWRIDAATALAEASPQGARRFLALGNSSGLLASLWMLARSVARELLWRILRPGVRVLERIFGMRGIRA